MRRKHVHVVPACFGKKLIRQCAGMNSCIFSICHAPESSSARRTLWFVWKGRDVGVWSSCILLANSFQHSVTNKRLSRLFKALPGEREAGTEARKGRRTRCSCARFFVSPWRSASLQNQMCDPLTLCNFRSQAAQTNVDGITADSLTFFFLILNQLLSPGRSFTHSPWFTLSISSFTKPAPSTTWE